MINFEKFKNENNLSEDQIFSDFFDHFHSEFEVRNKKIAVPKLKKIIKATFELSSLQSFAAMTLRELSQATGISMGGIYAYIQSKQQLSMLIYRSLQYFAEKIFIKIKDDGSENYLERLVRAHIYLSEVLRPWFFFVFMESKNLDKNQKKYAIQSELMMEEKLVEAIKNGQDREIYNRILTAETVAAHIKSLLHDWYLKRWKYKQREIDIEDFCFSTMIFINRGLTSPHSLTEFDSNE